MKRALQVGLPLLLIGAALAYYQLSQPHTPQALFLKRCSTCHALPDLSGYQKEELAPLVQFMRTHNGAYRVISDAEAPVIIAYLESRWPIST